jgi:hypothetical protein
MKAKQIKLGKYNEIISKLANWKEDYTVFDHLAIELFHYNNLSYQENFYILILNKKNEGSLSILSDHEAENLLRLEKLYNEVYQDDQTSKGYADIFRLLDFI